MKYIKENLSQAKAILRKNGLTQQDTNFIQIKELCKDKIGWLGLLTKLYYEFKIDYTEIEEIYSALKDSSHDLGKLNKMSYEEITDLIYKTELENSKDYELIFNINGYRFYKILTYDGILQIGSPAWCLKTGSHWRNYVKKGWTQYVIIKEDVKLLTPRTNYLSEYKNRNNSLVRIGITVKDDLSEFIAFDDNNLPLTKSFLITILLKKLKGEKTENIDLTDVVVLVDNNMYRLLFPKNKKAFDRLSNGVWTFKSDNLYYFFDSKRTDFMVDELIELENVFINVYDINNKKFSLSTVKSFDSINKLKDGLRELSSYVYKNKSEFKTIPGILCVASIHFGFRTEEDFFEKNKSYYKYNDYYCETYKSIKGLYCTSFIHKNLENYPYFNTIIAFREVGLFKTKMKFSGARIVGDGFSKLEDYMSNSSNKQLAQKLYLHAEEKAYEMIKKK